MRDTRKWSVQQVTSFQEMPQCTRNHTVPGILFSTGGYTGNHFHEFADVVIPLYINSQKYDGEVQFLITDKRSWWITKDKAVLQGPSKYEAINIDEDVVHCFPITTVGLKRHPKDLILDPSLYSYSMKEIS
ncbi:putative glycosyltransferase 61 [Rosa chinensis]|uniref:Putative glycosyltransferase 61 n=1 Tax=Rosa chinensis TaxID=74649 RepID=A0A2P6P223_ROSCH|nr:putative glycosyltransferase 61 [Rosa chinensis]